MQPESHKFLYSKTLIEEFLKSTPHKANKLYLNNQKKSNLTHIIKLAKNQKIPIISTNFKKFSKILENYKNVPAILEISEFSYTNVETIENRNTSLNIILLVYKVKDPRNLGAIMRTAKAFDIKGILITTQDSSPINSTVINTSRNNLLPTARINNTFKTIQEFKSKGYKILCLDNKGSKLINQINKIPDKTILILGGEKGIDNKIKELTETIKIPTKNVESLNTSVALAISLFYFSSLQ